MSAPATPARPRPPGDLPAVQNRVAAVMQHTSRYAFRGKSRLARDARVSRSTITRLLAGRARPSFALACAVTRALEAALHTRLDPRELFSLDGTFPTPSGCRLAGCRGCFPEEAYDADGNLRPQFRGQAPGEWSRSPEPDSDLDTLPPGMKDRLHRAQPPRYQAQPTPARPEPGKEAHD